MHASEVFIYAFNLGFLRYKSWNYSSSELWKSLEESMVQNCLLISGKGEEGNALPSLNWILTTNNQSEHSL